MKVLKWVRISKLNRVPIEIHLISLDGVCVKVLTSRVEQVFNLDSISNENGVKVYQKMCFCPILFLWIHQNAVCLHTNANSPALLT